jgi:gluconolactonase
MIDCQIMRNRAQIVAVLFAATASVSGADFEVKNQAEFDKLFPRDAKVQKIAGGLMFTEGPVWIPEKGGGYLIFSDIPADELKRWDPAGGVKTFRKPSGSANGNTVDREGRLITAEHMGRVSRTEKDGTVKTLVSTFEGKSLSSPNDVVVKSDGSIWFTDPDYGLGKRQKETPGNWVYRYNPVGSKLTAVVRDGDKPNGLCFSPDERTLYVADSGAPHHIRAFTVRANRTLTNARVFAVIDKGIPDGIRCDEGGRVWSSSGDGVQVFSPKGELIARVLLPEAAANPAFGGPNGRTLYATARTSLYSVETLVRGARRPGGK